MNKLLKHLCYFLVTCLLLTHNSLLTDNVSPAITDPDQLKAVETERQTIFNSLIDDLTKNKPDISFIADDNTCHIIWKIPLSDDINKIKSTKLLHNAKININLRKVTDNFGQI